MCLGGPSMSAAPTWTPPKARVVEPGPESPQDQLNNMNVENINERSQQESMRQANKGQTASKQKTQTSSKTDKAY
jgi:hypothetical protein